MQPGSDPLQPMEGAAAPPPPAAAAGQEGEQQESAFVETYVVDAGPCLNGNPLAHMLCCRGLAADWPVGLFDQQPAERGVKPNAALLPVSDNTTGKVYVAVVALGDITVAAGEPEDICIDYGLAYWHSRRDMERMLQASWVL